MTGHIVSTVRTEREEVNRQLGSPFTHSETLTRRMVLPTVGMVLISINPLGGLPHRCPQRSVSS